MKNIESQKIIPVNDFKKSDYKDWKSEAEKSLKDKPLDFLNTNTYEDISIKPIYSKEDIYNLQLPDNQYPGFYPFDRGTDASVYKTKKWFISQEISADKPELFNKKALHNISYGQTAVKIKFDKLNSSNIFESEKDFNIAFKNIDLSKIQINVEAGTSAPGFFGKLISYLSNKKYSYALGGIDFDPIGYFACNASLPYPMDIAYDNMAEMVKKNQYGIYTVGAKGDIYYEAGGNVVQELSFALATAVEYIRAMKERKIKIDDISQQIRFHFSAGTDFFMDIAKLRAVRMLWAKIIKEFGGNSDSQKIKMYIKTTGTDKSILDPYVNILRNTSQALSSILGGCDTLEIRLFDENFKELDEFSERISRNTQIVLCEECNLADIIDPAGGSYYIESLTNEIALQSWALFQEVEKLSGMYEALKQGFPESKIFKIRSKKMKNLKIRKDILLSVNKYPNIKEEFTIHSSQFTINKEQGEGKKEKGKSRKQIAEDSRLKIRSIQKFRGAEVFENLRLKFLDYKQKTGELPKVFIAAISRINPHKIKLVFVTDFMKVGGIEVIYTGVFERYEDAAKAFLESGLKAIVICAPDNLYPKFVPQLARLIKSEKPLTRIFIAGHPDENGDEFRIAGVDEFLHNKSNMVKVLHELYDSF